MEKKRFEEREKIVGNYINSDEGYCSYDSIFNLLDPDIETPNRDNLVDFLKSLNREEILLIVAVMYGGRDCSPPKWGTPLDSLVSLFNKDSKSDEELIGIILGKSPLLEYIKKGIQLYR